MKIFKNMFCFILMFIGFTFLGIGFLISSISKIDKTDRIGVKATIVSITSYLSAYSDDVYYDVLVQYDVDETTYVSELDAYSSDFYEGMEIEACYDRNDPSVVMYEDIENAFYIFPVIGFIMIVIDLLIFIDDFSKSSVMKRIKRKGEVAQAKYIGIESLNGTILKKQKIVCEWENPDDGKIYTFKSKILYYYYLEDIIVKNKIEYFEVRFLKKNPSKYLMNVDIIGYLANNYNPDTVGENDYIDTLNTNKFVENKLSNTTNDNPIQTRFNLSNNDVIKYK